MGDARRALDWEVQWACAIDPQTAKAIRDDRSPEHDDSCSMCGKFCAVRSMNKALNGEHIDILWGEKGTKEKISFVPLFLSGIQLFHLLHRFCHAVGNRCPLHIFEQCNNRDGEHR